MGSGILSVKNQFLVTGVKFYSKDPSYLGLFQGYPFENNSPCNSSTELIKPFLDHVLNIISDRNNDLYEYILNWISYLLQNPGSKTETALLVIGEQGTGKNKFFTDVISKLFGRYAIVNENNINNIIGRFNSSFENKILVICNELQSIDDAKHLNTDCLKSLITDNTCTIESKFVNSPVIDNVSNFIFVSNNYLPIKIENGDRRYVIFKTSNEHKNNFEYFADLNKRFTHEFYNELYNFFINRDLTKPTFNAKLIPITDIKNDMIESCKESWLLFFEDTISKFMKRSNCKLAYLDYHK
jgi:putative DNA primase/helicase